MDENLSRGYVLLKGNRIKLPIKFYYSKKKKDISKPGKSNVCRKFNNGLLDEDEEYLHQPTWSPGAASFSSTSNFCSTNTNQLNYVKKQTPIQRDGKFNFTNCLLDPENRVKVNIDPPIDEYNFVYLSLLLAGVGFLLPYNSFVIAVDYFQDHYPNTTIVFDINFIYIIVAFIAVFINNALVNVIRLNYRIRFGYFLSFGTLLMISIFEIGLNLFNQNTGYQLNLICVAIVAFGCTLQQSSFYGYTSMLPQKYTQAVMTGESAAGLIVSTSRIATKILIKDEQINTLFFFAISLLILACCIIVQHFLQKCKFVKYYFELCNSKTSNLSSNEDGLNDSIINPSYSLNPQSSSQLELTVTFKDDEPALIEQKNMQKNKLLKNSKKEKKESTPNDSPKIVPKSDSTEFDMPFGIDEEDLMSYVPPNQRENAPINDEEDHNDIEEDDENVSEQEDQQVIFENDLNVQNALASNARKSGQKKLPLFNSLLFRSRFSSLKILDLDSFNSFYFNHLKFGLINRIKVCKLIWPYMLSIGFAYFVTLSLFPGIESEIINCKLKSWTPVILMAVFNLTDFIGKIITPMFYNLNTINLIWCSLSRAILIPLLLFCVKPNEFILFREEWFPIFLTALLGISNGIFGSLPMILAPINISDEKKELTGNLMTLSYSIGLTSGSLLAYLFDELWAPKHDFNLEKHCRFNKTVVS